MIYYKIITFEGQEINNAYYLANYIKKQIKEDKDKEKIDVLLNYPAVYIHSWQSVHGEWNFYVGETNDLVRRTDEHDKNSNKDEVWQSDWFKGKNKKTIYFSSYEMNKSMSMDLEDELINLFRDEEDISLRNGRTNSQKSGYSNKNQKKYLIQEICEILNREFSSCNLKLYPKNNEDMKPVISEGLVVYYNSMKQSVDEIKTSIENMNFSEEQRKLLLEYPVVYMHVWETENGICTYIGETNDLLNRTKQHLEKAFNNVGEDEENKKDEEWWQRRWKCAIENNKATMYIFGHKQFNKSMTLDIENRLVQYSIFLGITENGRKNEQNEYSNKNKAFDIFSEIIANLNEKDSINFLSINEVKEKSIFMASPFLQLTEDQNHAKKVILNATLDCLNEMQENNTVIIVQGGAGTGKTVLASSLYFSLQDTMINGRNLNNYFIVNHKELFNAYNLQANMWKLTQENSELKSIYQAQNFINKVNKGNIVKGDVVLVDEAHLLYTQGTQGSIKKAQLPEIVKNSKVTILMYDPRQFVNKSAYWEIDGDYQSTDVGALFKEYLSKYIKDINIVSIDLTRQLRMNCAPETKKWIESLTKLNCEIGKLQGKKHYYSAKFDAYVLNDNNDYEIVIFNSIEGMIAAISQLKNNTSTVPSALLATYNWPFSNNTKSGGMLEGLPNLEWHKTGKKNEMKDNLWTFDTKVEVGSVHDIQGFDLKYAGVILGPSIQYSPKRKNDKMKLETLNGIQFKISEHYGVPNKEGDKDKACQLISNELGVLLSRGINGLYIYAMNEKLRKKLIEAVKKDD